MSELGKNAPAASDSERYDERDGKTVPVTFASAAQNLVCVGSD